MRNIAFLWIQGLYFTELQTEMAQIDNLKIKKRNIQSIQIIQEPYSGRYPVKPKIMLNVILAGSSGIFVMIFLVYLLEYISRHKKNEKFRMIS